MEDTSVNAAVPPTIFWLLAIWVVLVLAALVWGVDNAETKLRTVTASVIGESGLDLTFDLSGRDVTLYGEVATAEQAAELALLVDEIDGIRLVNDSLTIVTMPAPELVPPTVSMRLIGDAVSVRGSVATQETADALIQAAEEQYGADRVVNALTVADNVESQPWLGRIRDVFAPLADLRSGGFVANENGFILTGEVTSASLKGRIEQDLELILEDLLPFTSNLEIAVLPAPTVRAEGAAGVILLAGSVPDIATSDSIVDAARRLHPGSTIVNNLVVSEVAGPVWLEAVPGLLDVVTRLDPWTLVIANGQVMITGLTLDPDQVAAIEVLAAEVVDGQLEVVTDVEVDPAAVAIRLTELLKGSATFGPNDAILSAEGEALLDTAVVILLANPNARLIVEGHTDDFGAEAANLELSQQRAEAVVGYLVAGGIDRSRLTAIGYGETRPIADNVTAEGRALNRRIVFVIEEGDG